MIDDALTDVHQSLGCGINRGYFQQCFEKLSQKDQDRLYRVAQRFRFTTKLRHEASFWANPYVPRQKESSVIFSEIPTLEIYLLCTCLDTLAGKPNYMEFDSWLLKQPFLLDEQLSTSQVIELFGKYKEEYGIGKNVKKLFNNLPLNFKSWLSNNVIIRLEKDQSPFAPIEADQLITLLYKFYFEVWRNAYTHGSISRKVSTIEEMDEFKNKPEWLRGSPSPFKFSPKDNKSWNIYYQSANVDLSLILRMIVYSASLQFLGIELTQKLTENYLSNLHRTRLMYGILYEYRENFNLLNFWTKIRVMIDPLSTLPYITDALNVYTSYGIPTLASTALNGLLVNLDRNDDLEKQLYDTLCIYQQNIREFNQIIDSFKKVNRSRSDLPDNERLKLRNHIYEFLRKITAMPIFLTIRNYQFPEAPIGFLLQNSCVKIVFP